MHGGLGFIDLKAINATLLTKWAWKWVQGDSSLWVQLNQVFCSSLRPWQQQGSNMQFWHNQHIVGILVENFFIQPLSGTQIVFWHHDGNMAGSNSYSQTSSPSHSIEMLHCFKP